MKPYVLNVYEKAMPDDLPWRERLQSARECGFDALEVSVDESDARLSRLDWSADERRDLRRMAEDEGVTFRSICLSAHRKYPLGSHDPQVRRRSLEIMEKAVELAASLGVRVIQLAGYDVYYEQSDAQTAALFEQNLARCAQFAAAGGVWLGFETMETPFMDTVQKAMRYVHAVHSPYLALYPDVGNLRNASLLYGSDLLGDLCKGDGHILAAHLKETRPGTYRNLDIGQFGEMPYEACVRELYRMGVRMFTGEFWYQGEPDYRRTLMRTSKFLRETIGRAIA